MKSAAFDYVRAGSVDEALDALADGLGLGLPVLEATRPLYDRAVEHGLADADAAALLETLNRKDGR